MNIDNLNLLIKHLHRENVIEFAGNKVGFCMTTFFINLKAKRHERASEEYADVDGLDCGTSACIAGLACILANKMERTAAGNPIAPPDPQLVLSKFLDVDGYIAYNIAYPDPPPNWHSTYPFSCISRESMIRRLEALRDTGELVPTVMDEKTFINICEGFAGHVMSRLCRAPLDEELGKTLLKAALNRYKADPSHFYKEMVEAIEYNIKKEASAW